MFRNMQKHKLHTAINVIGMAVAFTCTILLLLLVYYQFSFDDFHQNKGRLFQVYSYSIGQQGVDVSGSMGYPVAPTLKSENTGIEKATRYKYGGRGVKYGDKELDLHIQLVDPDFFSMFSFPLVKGNRMNPLYDLGNAVISEYAAKRMFGTKDPVGRQILTNIGGEWKALVVSAVAKDFPRNSSINYDVLARPEISPDYIENKDKWSNTHHSVFVQLSSAAVQKGVEGQLRNITSKYNPGDTAFMKNKGYQPDENGDLSSLRLLPLAEVHFNEAINGSAVSKSFLYVLLLVSFVIVMIACFNFINLNIGLAFTRTKEMGIRKCLGAGKRQVWLQVWGESFVTVFIAMLIGTLTTIFILAYLSKTTDMNINGSMLYQPVVVFTLLVILFAVSFIASGYPAFIMGGLKVVEILKGKISLKKPGVFRNALIVVQFVIACVLICATIIIYQQFQHMRNAPLGYTTASLISIPIRNPGNGKNIVHKMRTRLSPQSSIVSVSGTSINLGVGQDGSRSKIGSGFDYNGKPVQTNVMPADYDILKTLNITVKEGRDFTTGYTADSNTAVIVTQSMAKQLSDKGVVGLEILSDSSRPKWNIVGVIPDFHLYSMHEKTEPLTIALDNNGFFSYILVRVATQNARVTMDLVKAAYAKVEPGAEFRGSYVDENIERWYKTEQALSQMFCVAALVAVVLSCMGLFGIAFIVIKQRVKEIGVRKVLGASVSSIAVLVIREFIKPVVIAIVIAIPVAWWTANKWLQDFEYRTTVEWTIFLATAFIAVLIAVATVSVHAIRAAVANPVKSLRME